MALCKTDAVVLRAVNQGETSKILTLYCQTSGRLSVIAKGCRNLKSRFGGALEPLNYISVVFYQKENRDLQHLNQAEIIDSFLETRKNLEKTAFSLAACELLDKLESGQEANPLTFRLLTSALRQIDACSQRPDNIFRAFQLHLSGIMGCKPQFSNCASCRLEVEGCPIFNLAQGGLTCRHCHTDSGEQDFELSSATRDLLALLQKTHISKVSDIPVKEPHWRQADAFLMAYLQFHFDGLSKLKSLAFLSKI